MDVNGQMVNAAVPATGTADREKYFYGLNSARVTLKEYAWGNPAVLLPLALLVKLLRIPVPASVDDPPIRDLEPFEVQELPESERERLAPLQAELAALGFVDPLYHRIEDPLHVTLINWITLRHISGKAWVRIHSRLWSYNQRTKERSRLFPIFFTELEDGSFVVSSSGKPDMLAPPSWIMNRQPGLPTAQLWELHQKTLAAAKTGSRAVPDLQSVREALAREHAAATRFHLQRGVFTELSGTEQRCAARALAPEGRQAGFTIEDAAVIAEIRRQEGCRSGWGALLLTAVVTLVLFLSLGATQQPLRFLFLVVAVLGIHELGHFVAMKIIGYRNMRVFFIPFLGAAVSGQHYHVAGWKQSLVALAGPLPGIALGVIAGIAGTLADSALTKEFALMLLVLNGFNLLPLMPLDGGRVLHAVLFCRHPVLNVVSQALAALVFIGLGLLAGDRIIGIIGVFVAVGLPTVYKAAKITARHRRQAVSVAAPGAAAIPDECVIEIMGEVRREFRKGLPLKAQAEMVTNIFSTLNAKPPGWLVSCLFVFVLFASFSVATVAASLMYVAKQGHLGNFGNLFNASMNRPQMTYTVGTVRNWRGPACPAERPATNFTVAANFATAAKAQELFAKLPPRLPPEASAVLFGHSLALDLPFVSETEVAGWLTRMEADGAQESFAVREGFELYLSLSFLMPTVKAADALRDELAGYFAFCGKHPLIPPWSPAWNVKHHAIDGFRRARATYGLLVNDRSTLSPAADAEQKSLARERQAALKRGDRKAMEQISLRQREIWQEKQKKHDAEVRAAPQSDVHVVELYQQWRAAITVKDKAAELRQALGACMGSEPAPDTDQPRSRCTVKGGWASNEMLLLDLTCSGFDVPPDGISEIARWLAALRVTDVKYNLYHSRHLSEDEEDEADAEDYED